MNPPRPALERRLLELLHAARDQGDTAARADLNALLRADPAARAAVARLLVDEFALSSRLREDELIAILDNENVLPFAPATPPASVSVPAPASQRSWWAWAAAALCVLGLTTFVALRFLPTAAIAANEPMPVAVLQEQADAVWRDTALAAGAALTPGPRFLESGLVALEFSSGARLLIEGPAEFELISSDHVYFKSGSLSADVPPPAKGFTISTPEMRVVDLGTRFGISLSSTGKGIVRVEKGEVEVHRKLGQRNLLEGDAIAFDKTGDVDTSLFPDYLIPSENDLSQRLASSDARRTSRWRNAFARLASDPATLFSYDFAPSAENARSAANRAPAVPGQSAVSLVGAAWTEGRWSGKSAVEFRGPADRLRLQCPGIHQALTFLCWVRVDSLPNDFNGLLLPGDYQAGSVQWMIRQDGQLRFSLFNGRASPGSPQGWDKHIVAPAITPLDFGRWVLLATTYDSTSGLVQHYRDGSLVGSGKLDRPLPAVLGSMGVGNWANSRLTSDSQRSEKNRSNYRNLVGRLDELTVLSRVLTAEELAAYYESGRP